MQIIRSSRDCRWLGECKDCGCIFIYKGDEISRQQDEVNVISVVMCPECKERVQIPNMAFYRRPAVRGSSYCDEEGEWDDL